MRCPCQPKLRETGERNHRLPQRLSTAAMYSYRSFSFARRLVLAACLLLVARPGLAQTVDSIEATPALHEVFADHFTSGALLSYPHVGLPNDPVVPGQSAVVSPTGGYLIRHHMNFMAPGNNMKPQNT